VADCSCLIHLCVMDDALAAVVVMAAIRTLLPSVVSRCLPGPHPALIHSLGAGLVVNEHNTCMSTLFSALAVTWVYSPGLA